MIDYNELKDYTLKDFENQYYTVDALNNLTDIELEDLIKSLVKYVNKIRTVQSFNAELEREAQNDA